MKAWDDFKASSPIVQIIVAFMVIFVVVGLLCTCIFVFRMLTGTSELVNRLEHEMVFVTPTTSSAPAETDEPEEPSPPSEAEVTPTPIIFTNWRGEYFDNPNLEGEPVLVRNDEHIDFDWTGTSPEPGAVPDSNYSVRWTTSREVNAGGYRLNVHFDHGVRVWVDEFLVIDEWRDGPVRTASADVNVAAGVHVVRVEYYHLEGQAVIQLAPQQQENFPDWKAEYFDNPALANAPVAVRNELDINYNWGTDSPIPGVVPADNYSIRWGRIANFAAGNHLFVVDVEGGVRVWLNGQILIDSWGESERRQLEATTRMDQGGHGLTVEYWKATGNGAISFGWGLLPEPDQPPIAVINGPTYAYAGQTISFNAKSSRASEGSKLVGFSWDMGDGTQSDQLVVNHVYANPGQYVVTLQGVV